MGHKTTVITSITGLAGWVFTTPSCARHDGRIAGAYLDYGPVKGWRGTDKTLGDAAYIGLERFNVIAVTGDDERRRRDLSSTRIWVEAHFGRLINKFRWAALPYHSDIEDYDVLAKLAHALTNYDILLRPLNDPDAATWDKYVRLLDIEEVNRPVV